MILSLYRGLTTIAGPLIALYLRRRRALGKEDALRFGERRGIAGRARPVGRLVWLHAASVGEAVSMISIVERLCSMGRINVLMTTGTVTSAELMERRLPVGAFHQYVPVDRIPWVRRFLDHWRPDVALWSESELWPNLVSEVATRGVPLVLLNGRMSARSYGRWRRQPRLIRDLLSGFALCLAQTIEDADRLAALGAPVVRCVGNLKFAAPPLTANEERLATLLAAIGTRPCWLAASTHFGDEVLAARIHQRLVVDHPGLLTVIVPRHPARGAAVAADLAVMGLKVSRRSLNDPVEPASDILLGDTLGEMGEFFRLGNIVFMGKSLVGQGGQNPLEPARLGATVLFGPHMENFLDIANRMVAARAALQVPDEAALQEAIDQRLRTPALAVQDGLRAQAFASSEAGVLDRVMAELSPWLRTPEEQHASS